MVCKVLLFGTCTSKVTHYKCVYRKRLTVYYKIKANKIKIRFTRIIIIYVKKQCRLTWFCARSKKTVFGVANNKGSGQYAHLRSLISAFVNRLIFEGIISKLDITDFPICFLASICS